MEQLNKLLKEKELNSTSPEDIEKINVIKNLFADEAIFFKIDIDTAYGILAFLGIPEDKISDTYMSLITPEEYMRTSRPYLMGPTKNN